MKRLALAVLIAVAAVAWWRRPRYLEADLNLPPYDPRLWEVME